MVAVQFLRNLIAAGGGRGPQVRREVLHDPASGPTAQARMAPDRLWEMTRLPLPGSSGRNAWAVSFRNDIVTVSEDRRSCWWNVAELHQPARR